MHICECRTDTNLNTDTAVSDRNTQDSSVLTYTHGWSWSFSADPPITCQTLLPTFACKCLLAWHCLLATMIGISFLLQSFLKKAGF